MHRVTELADRAHPQRPHGAADFHYIIPLPEILSEVRNASPSSKMVSQHFQQTISSFGNEFTLLNEVPIEDIEKKAGIVLAEAIRRMRAHEVNPQGGYDGEYGVIRIFKEGEVARLTGQLNFFGLADGYQSTKRERKETVLAKPHPTPVSAEKTVSDTLNLDQTTACETAGSVLVTAGPGTGKTKTLIQWMVDGIRKRGVRPHEVMAVTFTNKAADEVKTRLAAELGAQANDVMLGTFHSLCFAILQAHDERLTHVYDAESRRTILSMLFPATDEKTLKRWADRLEDYFETNGTASANEIQQVIAAYRQFAAQHGGIDVADIIGAVVRFWKADPVQLDHYRGRVRCIAVDELQDINPVQYAFLLLLAKDKHVFAIGDPDQAIYGFRGADVKLFFRFAEDFGAKEVALRHNYRATDTLVRAACQVIRNNVLHKDTGLQAHRPGGDRIRVFTAADEHEEAAFVVNEIEKAVGGFSNLTGDNSYQPQSERGFSDIAVLFRTRAIGRYLLAAFRKAGIPVRYGDATPFLATYPFHLVTDALKLYLNPEDVIALDSLLTHGFGMDRQRKQAFLAAHPTDERFAALFGPLEAAAFAKQGAEGAVSFVFERLILDSLLDEAGLLQKEMIVNLAKEYGPGIRQFLHKLLVDTYTDVARFKTDAVNLLTFHAAKGLEFPVVFIVGAEEGTTPLATGDADIEEERRLFYVALTRAKEKLFISHTARRKSFDKTIDRTVSRFVGEIPLSMREKIQGKQPKAEQMRLF